MRLIDHFLTEHPFFSALLEHERRILAHYIELYRCPKGSYLVLPGELQEVLWIVARGRLAEYAANSAGAQSPCANQKFRENPLPNYQGNSQGNFPENLQIDLAQKLNIHAAQAAQAEQNQAAQNKNDNRHKAETLEASKTKAENSQQTQSTQNTKSTTDTRRPMRYFLPGDLINAQALTEELVAPNEILSLEDETQVICISAFHLAKLAQQQPKIHRALRPLYSDEGYLVSGLPAPVWRQMGSIAPPHTRDFGKNWLQRKPLLRAYCSWHSSILAFLVLGALNIWQFYRPLAYPYGNIVLLAGSLLVLIFFVVQRYRCEYTLKRSLLHITERSLLGLSSKIKSYPLLSVREVKRIPIPLLGRLFDWGGLRICTHCGETVQIFPIDRVQKWQKALQEGLSGARELQKQLQNREGAEQRQKHHKLQPELIKEINYRNATQEGKLPKSRHTLAIPLLPLFALGLLALYYSVQSELYKIYLTIPLIAIGLLIAFQSLRWLRYSWRISEEFLLRRDHLLGPGYDYKILICDIRAAHLEYLSILGFGSISLNINGEIIRLQNLRHPQNILDEIESLRQCAQNSAQPDGAPDEVWGDAWGPALGSAQKSVFEPAFDASTVYHHAFPGQWPAHGLYTKK